MDAYSSAKVTATDGLCCAQRLVDWFDPGARYAIALSGGVDSAVVASGAARSNAQDVVCLIGLGPALAERELQSARRVADGIGLAHRVIHTSEIEDPSYTANDAKRCYFCKSHLFRAIAKLYPMHTIVTGTNADDLEDYRPGLAAASEAGVRAPLAELGIGKVQVRRLANDWKLEIADKPASPCLASRIAYGVPVTSQRLHMIEQAEKVLREFGLEELRVRVHADELARIEVPSSQIGQIADPVVASEICQRFKEIGFRFVTLDLQGFRTGSFNQLLQIQLPTVSK
ncbi:MAG: ATP-dependent sacrificial sulfur transferase LarE [Planctomycetales bacterium]|nr:ATP-dependent sacrificial sulfur transferase LarE [Planctomycetales bacterium]